MTTVPPTPPGGPAGTSRRRRRRLGSTYRLQLQGLGFAGAAELVPYLDELGVETIYASPLSAAVAGSTHGYDVVDPTRLDPGLGTTDDLARLLDALGQRGMRLLVDIVPNHTATSEENPWWWDVLTHGRRSEFAPFFDIDWTAQDGRVLVPVLGRPLQEVLAAGELSVAIERDGPVLRYADRRLPLDPTTHHLAVTLLSGGNRAGSGGGDPGRAGLVNLLDAQHYRLAHWRSSRYEVNYRRFFDIDDLVGMRVEDPTVYRATHRLVLELVHDERVAGVRVDHVDGLADPGVYLARLRHDLDDEPGARPVLVVEKILSREELLPATWPVDGTTGYEFADLAGGLFIDAGGASAMATPRSAVECERANAERGGVPSPATGAQTAFGTDAKREVLSTLFPGQVDRLVALAGQVLEHRFPGLDVPAAPLRQAMVELSAQLDVYRTYAGAVRPLPVDTARVERAARRATAALDADGVRALKAVVPFLNGQDPPGPGTGRGDEPPTAPPGHQLELVRRWQQLSGAAAAKGVEDTAFYRFGGLLAAAEVGGDPTHPSVSPEEFHAAMRLRQRRHPGSLNTTSTHDTKRSEDVRARLAVLSEVPGLWSAHVERWRGWHQPWTAGLATHDELFAYQAIVGAWPLDASDRPHFSARISDYLVKAAREAKVCTTWLDPDEGYERRLRSFARHVLAAGNGRFRRGVGELVSGIGPAAAANSMAMTVLKTTAPGVPDVYQGTELWSHSLADPDNRRPIDFGRRRRLLDALPDAGDAASPAPDPAELVRTWTDGRLKLWLLRTMLQFRRDYPDLVDRGTYLPLESRGPLASHLVAFTRSRGRQWLTVAVPRLLVGRTGLGTMPVGAELWRQTSILLPDGAPERSRDVLGGAVHAAVRGRLSAGELFATVPVAVLISA